MRTLVGFAFALLISGSGFAQYRGSTQPYITGGFGSVVYPAGTAATNPGLHRITPNPVYPGGGGPRLVVPNTNGGANRGFRRGGNGSFVYSYPVYVGGYMGLTDPSMYDGSAGAPQQQSSGGVSSGGVTIVMPPAQPPVVINQYSGAPPNPQMITVPPEDTNAQETDTAPETPHYLLAFKDHTIYSAIAYWVDGDTLHYFTTGNTHNQVSLSLVDRPLTERLNKDTGAEVKLPQ